MRLNGYRHFLSDTSHFSEFNGAICEKIGWLMTEWNFLKVCGFQVIALNKPKYENRVRLRQLLTDF